MAAGGEGRRGEGSGRVGYVTFDAAISCECLALEGIADIAR